MAIAAEVVLLLSLPPCLVVLVIMILVAASRLLSHVLLQIGLLLLLNALRPAALLVWLWWLWLLLMLPGLPLLLVLVTVGGMLVVAGMRLNVAQLLEVRLVVVYFVKGWDFTFGVLVFVFLNEAYHLMLLYKIVTIIVELILIHHLWSPLPNEYLLTFPIFLIIPTIVRVKLGHVCLPGRVVLTLLIGIVMLTKCVVLSLVVAPLFVAIVFFDLRLIVI